MTRAQKLQLRVAATAILIVVVAVLLLFRWQTRLPLTIRGAVTVMDADSRKERPIADVEVLVRDGIARGRASTDSSGYFQLTLARGIRRGDPIFLHFRHAGYQPLDVQDFVGDKLYIEHLTALEQKPPGPPGQPEIKVSNVRVRYTSKSLTEINVGSAVKTFQVENKGNVLCRSQHPCSPDGKWKAALGATSLDAGPANFFRNHRISCIAGPCPFTRIESERLSQGGQVLTVSARDWSDTATFLVEAEVFHPMTADLVHESYPVIFGQALNFTLPASAEGVSIQADINRQTIMFPLGPALFLSWASCNARVNPDQTRVYRCELKPGYSFQ